MRLIVLGDSHALYSYAGVAEAKIFWRGPITMHRAARDGISTLVPGNCRPVKGDLFVLSFGEIDCRAHIKKQATLQGNTTLEQVDDLCLRFERAVDTFQARCPAAICLTGVVPFNPKFLEYHRYPDADACLSDAKAIRDRMNANLESMKYPFVNFRSAFANIDGSIKPKMSDGNVHIDCRCSEPVLIALNIATGVTFSKREPPWPNPRGLVEPPYHSPMDRAYGRIKKLGGALRRPFRFIRMKHRKQKH